MMHEEFEKIAGYEVSYEDYTNIIEPMYMALTVSKEDFVKMIDKKRFALKPIKKIVKEMREIGEERKENCSIFYSREQEEKLDNLVREYIDRKGYKGMAHFQIETEQKHSCYYPKMVVIYSAKTYKTIETIEIA